DPRRGRLRDHRHRVDDHVRGRGSEHGAGAGRPGRGARRAPRGVDPHLRAGAGSSAVVDGGHSRRGPVNALHRDALHHSAMTDPLSLFDLSGKVALVTGGSRGLGRSMVLAFAACGADVVIVSRKIESCEELATEVEKTTGRAALPFACHVGEWGQLDALADAAYDRFGKVDVLVNNAGMSPLYDALVNVTEPLYDKVLDVNLKGPFRLSALIGTRMAQGDGGSIISVSSVAAI